MIPIRPSPTSSGPGWAPPRGAQLTALARPARRIATFLLCFVTGAGSISAQPAVMETAFTFVAQGDFDGDARADVLVVDKASGTCRIGYSDAAGQLGWTPAESSGLSPATTVTIARVNSETRDAIVVASPEANRVHVVRIAGRGQPPGITQWYPAQIGPYLALGLDIGGPGNGPGDDLLLGTRLNSTPPGQLGLYRPGPAASALPALQTFNVIPGTAAAARAARLEASSPVMAALLRRLETSATLEVFDLRNGAFQTALQIPGLPPGTAFASGMFSGETRARFLFWDPADATGTLTAQAIAPGPAGAWTPGSAMAFALGDGIQQVELLNPATGSELAVVFASGRAASYRFDGSQAPQALTELAPPGAGVQALVALGPDRLVRLHGTAGGAPSQFTVLQRTGNTWNPAQSGDLPHAAPLRGMVNVWEFRREPYVNPNPELIAEHTIEDWTSGFSAAALPLLRVSSEQFRSSEAGLGDLANFDLGLAAGGTGFVMVNQRQPAISMFGVNRPGSQARVRCQAVPASGEFSGSIQVRFNLEPPTAGARVHFRFENQAAWQTYASPFRLYAGTTISYYAEDAAGSLTEIQSVRYRFRAAPGRLDSDADGVPDYVEESLGLDPTAGPDSDADGFGDLDEIIAGTLPGSASSRPAASGRQSTADSFSAEVAPLPYDGRIDRYAILGLGQTVSSYSAGGQLLQQATHGADSSIPFGRLQLGGLPRVPGDRLLVLALPENFEIFPNVLGADTHVGRELLAVQHPPAAHAATVPFEWTSGDVATAAAGWIASARSTFSAEAAAPEWELSPRSTLTALLVERKLESVLAARGWLSPGQRLTLFPHRPQDIGRRGVPDGAYLELRQTGPAGQPALRLDGLRDDIEAGLLAPNAGPITNLVLDLYRISSRHVASEPPLPLPVDALRTFLDGQSLPGGYAARTALTPTELAQARTALTGLLAPPRSRPVADLTLTVRPDTAERTDCTLLDDGTGNVWSLLAPTGDAWPLFDGFRLPAGTRVHVRGFTDVPASCGAPGLSVDAIELISVPSTVTLDSDGDLLADAWERQYFGDLAQSGSDDFDRDGFSNMQEFLEGTNPIDIASHGARSTVSGPPALALQLSAAGTLQLNFNWPEALASRINFEILSAPGLGEPFSAITPSPIRGPDGLLTYELPPPTSSSRFYLLRLSLR